MDLDQIMSRVPSELLVVDTLKEAPADIRSSVIRREKIAVSPLQVAAITILKEKLSQEEFDIVSEWVYKTTSECNMAGAQGGCWYLTQEDIERHIDPERVIIVKD